GLVNEAMVRALGGEGTAIAKQFRRGNQPPMAVAGVVKDFHFGTMRHQIEPLLIRYQPGANRTMAIKVSTENLDATLAGMETAWRQVNPQDPFAYSFFDQEFAQQYAQERSFARITVIFTWLAIFIACLGLLGLSAFAAEQRTKEIGIRKILGASVPELLRLLSKELTVLVGLSALIALPLAAYLLEDWLSGYAYRIDLPWWVFILALVGAMSIALLTNSYHALRTAYSNPVQALRRD
ncbi:MAG: FtsX-like permease family protein, partial [Bacteroidota bacterium]